MNNDNIKALREVHDFLAQVKSALKCKKIRDVDTGWRMANQILPSAKSFERIGDMEETECSYRKIHLSDVLDVALSLPWDTLITQLEQAEQGVDLEKGINAIWAESVQRVPDWETLREKYARMARACYEANNVKVKE